MGINLCGCNNDPGPSTEANLVIIIFKRNLFFQVDIKNKEKNKPKEVIEKEKNSVLPSVSDISSISPNELKSITSNNLIKPYPDKKEVRKNILLSYSLIA